MPASQNSFKSSLLAQVSLLLIFLLLIPRLATAQATGGLRGQVLDPSGAVVPGATITLTQGATLLKAASGSDGNYSFRDVPAGAYSLTIDAQGFTFPTTDVSISSRVRQMNLTLAIAVQQQNVQVTSHTSGVSVNPDENSGAIVLSGHDLDSLSDDPDQQGRAHRSLWHWNRPSQRRTAYAHQQGLRNRPKIKGTRGSGFSGGGGGGSVSGRGLGGAQAGPKLDASVPRKYSLTIVATSFNLLNIVNQGTPNGVLKSTLFGTTQSLAGDGFGSNTAGNRSIFLQAMFNF